MTIKWRKVEDELPSGSEACLLTQKNIYIISFWSGEDGYIQDKNIFVDGSGYEFKNITHWIYLQDLLKLEGME